MLTAPFLLIFYLGSFVGWPRPSQTGLQLYPSEVSHCLILPSQLAVLRKNTRPLLQALEADAFAVVPAGAEMAAGCQAASPPMGVTFVVMLYPLQQNRRKVALRQCNPGVQAFPPQQTQQPYQKAV